MKKRSLWAIIALAGLTISSCTNDEVIPNTSVDNAIEFGTYLGRDAQSRGIVLNNQFDNFGVFASYTGQDNWTHANTSNFMFNQLVENTNSAWTYSPKKYWPTTKNDMISFFAYAPHASQQNDGVVVKSGSGDASVPVITYSIAAENLLTQADFVADVLMNVKKDGTGSSIDSAPTSVDFSLVHELTRLGITAQLDRTAFDNNEANKTKINIKSIKFVGEGEFYTSADYVFAATTNGRGRWDNKVNGGLDIAKLLDVATPASDALGGYIEPGILLANTTSVSLFKKTDTEQNYMFMIPVNESGLTADGKIKMEVEYDIVTVDEALENNHIATPTTKIIEFPAGSMKQGVAYNFHLTFGLNEVILTANVANWDETGSFESNVDWPKNDK